MPMEMPTPRFLPGLAKAAQRALAGEMSAPSAQGRHRIAKSRAAEVTDLLENIAPHFSAPATWHARSAALKNLSVLPPAPVPADFTAVLRPYQQLGVAWLWHLHGQELGGILADEMGLGKTLQALALLAAISRRENQDPAPAGTVHLVVVPASLVENWRREAARFAPTLRVFVHHGAARLAREAFANYDLILTSYGTLARDTELFAGGRFGVILADEAQHLKNRRTQAAQALRGLRGRSRFLLTGTPLENSLDDLRSLFEFLMPGFLPKLPAGMKREERAFHDERLRLQTAPYILRRTKAGVAPELPPKIEQVIWCEPTAAQAALYRRLQEESERAMAQVFADAAAAAGVQRIVYLGGLAPEIPAAQMSPHMRSRVEVGAVLRSSGVPTVEFRAAVIIGSGSASFEMLRYLIERLPGHAPHHVERAAIGRGTRVVERHDAVMLESRGDLDLAHEASRDAVAAHADFLQRDGAAELRVVRLPHAAEAAAGSNPALGIAGAAGAAAAGGALVLRI